MGGQTTKEEEEGEAGNKVRPHLVSRGHLRSEKGFNDLRHYHHLLISIWKQFTPAQKLREQYKVLPIPFLITNRHLLALCGIDSLSLPPCRNHLR